MEFEKSADIDGFSKIGSHINQPASWLDNSEYMA